MINSILKTIVEKKEREEKEDRIIVEEEINVQKKIRKKNAENRRKEYLEKMETKAKIDIQEGEVEF